MYPMSYASFTREGRSVGLVWADSTERVVSVLGDLPDSWLRTDATVARIRLDRAGWELVSEGKVEE